MEDVSELVSALIAVFSGADWGHMTLSSALALAGAVIWRMRRVITRLTPTDRDDQFLDALDKAIAPQTGSPPKTAAK